MKSLLFSPPFIPLPSKLDVIRQLAWAQYLAPDLACGGSPTTDIPTHTWRPICCHVVTHLPNTDKQSPTCLIRTGHHPLASYGQVDQILGASEVIFVAEGERVVCQGEHADYVYVVWRGGLVEERRHEGELTRPYT